MEGSWPEERAIGVLQFASARDALMWLDSDTDVKQNDWLHGADIVIAPMLRCTGTYTYTLTGWRTKNNNTDTLFISAINRKTRVVSEPDHCVLQISDCSIHDIVTFTDQYVGGHLPELLDVSRSFC